MGTLNIMAASQTFNGVEGKISPNFQFIEKLVESWPHGRN